MDVRVGPWSKPSSKELMLSSCRAGEDSGDSFGLQRDQISQSYGKSTLNTRWKDWCWSWNSGILVIRCEQLTHWKSPWCWERLRAEEEGIRGWMAGWHSDAMDMNLDKLREITTFRRYREACCAAVHGVAKSRTWLSDSTTSNHLKPLYCQFPQDIE